LRAAGQLLDHPQSSTGRDSDAEAYERNDEISNAELHDLIRRALIGFFRILAAAAEAIDTRQMLEEFVSIDEARNAAHDRPGRGPCIECLCKQAKYG
jgi:hypothetical protein